jgi:serine/threonine protein kinase
MGVVYRALNERPTVRRYEAVKVIAEDLSRDAAFRDRFLREAAISIELEHPHVIPVYDVDEGSGGHLFIAMRYIDQGRTVATLIREQGRLEPEAAARLITAIASALDAAHARDLVHRDVKPTNVLLTGAETPHAYLTDFGLSKRVSSETMLSGAGSLVGTVDYMSPEQAQGHTLDRRTDIYALGVTLFEALTGTLPFSQDTDTARLMAKVGERPPTVREIVPDLAPAFDEVVGKALELNPGDRYASAGELAAAARAAAEKRTTALTLPPQEIGVGSVLADCRIEEVAGEGGMGVVYRATQQNLGKTVALKVMARALAGDQDFRVQFEREWKVSASLEHPNVVPIYWAGEAEGRLFIVMRYVDGYNLREVLAERGRLEPERAVEVAEQLAGALDAAHSRGLVHRDVKPGNILVERASGRVFLTDFGLAREVANTDSDKHDAMGTARYMAPERYGGGEADEVLGDVYSLGCVLWDMLSGTERVDPRTVPEVPPALAEVVARSIERDASARFASAGDLARAARAALVTDVPREPSTVEMIAGSSIDERRNPFEPAPLSSGLREQVLALCREVHAATSHGEARNELESIARELEAPLRLAVRGEDADARWGLVSAITGRRLSATGSLSALGVPMTISHGASDEVSAALESGGQREFEFEPDGSLPGALFADDAGLASITIRVSEPSLRQIALTYEQSDGVSDSASSVAEADAYFLTVSAEKVDDTGSLLAEFDATAADSGLSAVNTTLVVTTSDELSDSEETAARVKEMLGFRVAAVTVVDVKAALAAIPGLLENDQIAAIGELAAADAATRTKLLASPEAFVKGDGPPAQMERIALLEMLGLPGVRSALQLADAEQLHGAELRRRLREISGLEDVGVQIAGFHQRADALKADRALERLDEMSYRWPEMGLLRDSVEEIRLRPEFHVTDLIHAFEKCATGEVQVPADLLSSLEKLITSRSPRERLGLLNDTNVEDLRAAAMEGFREWKSFENSGEASSKARRVARVVARSYEFYARDEEGITD